MSWQSKKRWVSVCATGYLGAALAACQEPAPAEVTLYGANGAATVTSANLSDVDDVLRTLKHLTVAYRDINAAKAAGYDAQLTACSVSPAGGQGFHYGSLPLFDAKVEPLRPEMLMYEPRKNGELVFVGVEYAVPYTAWTNPSPPTLAGVPFRRNDAFQLYVLHAWIWNHNPSGIHADWNPRVTCQFAQ